MNYDYIKKEEKKFVACKSKLITQDEFLSSIDNLNVFDSRYNYPGYGGPYIAIQAGQFIVEWTSNYHYGSKSKGFAYIVFKGILVREHKNIMNTEEFVKILNQYLNFSEKQKDQLIYELANNLGQFRVAVYPHFLSLTEECDPYLGYHPRFMKPKEDFNKELHEYDYRALSKIKEYLNN